MSNGMSEREYQNRMREIIFRYLAAPAVILISMAVIGSIIDSFTHTTGTFGTIFSIVGGVPGIAFYYYREWKIFADREVPKKEILENQKKILDKLDEIHTKLNK